MQEDFFVGFDNDMDDFQNIVGKIKQRRADLKEATGAKTVLGAKLKRVVKPLSTQKNLKQIRDTRKAGAMTPDVPADTPTDTPIEETMAGAMTPDMVADMGSDSGDTKSTSGGGISGLSTGAKIGIGVGALVVIGTIIFFVARKK
jgi:hypothetical protein